MNEIKDADNYQFFVDDDDSDSSEDLVIEEK
jgi:hypothetical protein